MEKAIFIDGKNVSFKSTGATPLRYKAQFGNDFFAEIMKLDGMTTVDAEGKTDISGIDFEVFYNLAWVLAKTADPSIKDPLTWLDTFEEFPIVEILPELQDLIFITLQGKKK